MLLNINVRCLMVVGTLLLTSFFSTAQTYTFEMLSSSKPTNLRGLSAVDSLVVWTCGSNGYVGKSVDGGTTWEWVNPLTYEKSDFRDVHAISADTAIVMAAGTPAYILRTTDGGLTWYEAFSSNDKRVFLHALDFWDSKTGFCIGDWVNKKPYNLSTYDGGKTWELIAAEDEGYEAGATYFAASGTCLRAISYDGDSGIVAAISTTLDKKPVHGFIFFEKYNNEYDEVFYDAPYITKEPSEGLFSLAVDFENELLWLVGGNYAKPNKGFSTYYNIDDEDFAIPKSQVNGYRSCVELFKYQGKNMVIACGPNGADVSISDVKKADWKTVSALPLNTAKTSRKGNTVFLCGKQGTIYKLKVE